MLLLLLLFTYFKFFTSVSADGLSLEIKWRLSKSPEVSRTLHSILVILNNAVVWMVFTCSPTSKSSIPYNNPLPKAPIKIGIIATFMFHSFSHFPSKVEVLIVLFTFFQCYSVISWNSRVHNFAISLFFCWLSWGLDIWLRLSDPFYTSKSHRSLCTSFSRRGVVLSIYHLFVWSNLNFLHISQSITLPTQACLVL